MIMMEWKDALGVDIVKGDYIAYPTSKGDMQLGRVVELTTQKQLWDASKKIPAIKVVGARKEWDNGYTYKKMTKASTLFKLDNVLVIRNNLPATLLLI